MDVTEIVGEVGYEAMQWHRKALQRVQLADLQHAVSVAARRCIQEFICARFILARDVARHQCPHPHQVRHNLRCQQLSPPCEAVDILYVDTASRLIQLAQLETPSTVCL